jgi:hypothetical protein
MSKLFAFILMLSCVMQPAPAAEAAPVVHQLRIYEIFDRNKQAFHARFRDHAMRIMAKYDFKILATWETQHNGRTEFANVCWAGRPNAGGAWMRRTSQWPDRATLTDRWARFMADPEWAAIKKRTAAEHGQMVGEIQDRVLDVQDYSPTHTFAIPVSL